ncbi:hypothetical protein [Larkinella terrae]|uniref:Uncharacterized protein n=1 Tax=Larkinella terrae TaxID=2025311 RepID=A0A7K0EJT6_9BACT|nr:hypothetical protein [Larkinella terrae]MRS62123.1 hypothetical protein [Larkinella terrae]
MKTKHFTPNQVEQQRREKRSELRKPDRFLDETALRISTEPFAFTSVLEKGTGFQFAKTKVVTSGVK